MDGSEAAPDPYSRGPSSGTPLSSTGVDNLPSQTTKSVKRPRPVKSCAECRKRKLRCDRLCPCSQCTKSRRMCTYPKEKEENGAKSEDADSEEIETTPRDRPSKRLHRTPIAPPISSSAAHHDIAPALPSPHAVRVEVNPALLLDMSSRLERMEKMLAAKRPLTSETPPSVTSMGKHYPGGTLPVVPVTVRGLSVKGDLRTRFFGQNSTKVLLNLFDDAKVFMQNMAATDGLRDLFVQMQTTYKALQREHRRLLQPLTVYVDSMTPVHKRMADILPPKAVCDKLLDVYMGSSESMYRILHIPTFLHEYEEYFQGKCRDVENFLPRLLLVLSIGSRFGTEARGLSPNISVGVHCPTAHKQVRTWLDSLQGKQLVDFTTLQAEVLLLHAQRTLTPKNQESWTQLGYIVRQAMCMGLHRDPSEFPQISVFWGENRRKLWYTIMDMDFHVALSCNLPCAVREGEYSCSPPRNLNDADIYPEMTELPEGKPIDQYTDTQLQAYCATTLPYRLKVSAIINRLDSIGNFDEVLQTGADLQRLIDEVNTLFPRHGGLDPRKTFHMWRMRALLDMHVRRPLLSLYRPFALNTAECPPIISNSYLRSAMVLLTYLDELDQSDPVFNDVHDMYQLVMKHDIIQAAFSVCFYIKNYSESHLRMSSITTPMSSTPPDPTLAESPSSSSDNRPLWSTGGLVRAVEKTLDSHIGLIKDSSSDLKDVVALSIVLSSVQAAPPEQKLAKIKAGIRRVLDASMQALSSKTDGLQPLPMTPTMPMGAPMAQRRTSDMYSTDFGQGLPYMLADFSSNGAGGPVGIPDEFPLWEFDWWLPASFSNDQG